MGKENGNKGERNAIFILLVVALLLGFILILLGQVFGEQEGIPWANIVSNSGIALVSAAVVAMVLERYLRERLYQELRSQVGAILSSFGTATQDAANLRRLPPELQDVTRKTLVEATVIERDVDAHYEMTLVPADKRQLLRINLRNTSIYENLTDTEVSVNITDTEYALYEKNKGLDQTNDAGFVSITSEIIEGSIIPALSLNKATMVPFISQQLGAENFRCPFDSDRDRVSA